MEALLIRALGLAGNVQQTKFNGASEWTQVKLHEVDDYLSRSRSISTRPRRGSVNRRRSRHANRKAA